MIAFLNRYWGKQPDSTTGYRLIKQYIESCEQEKLKHNALIQFKKEYYDFVYKKARYVFNLQPIEAEDMFSNVFLGLIASNVVAKLENTPTEFNAYVYGIIKNLACRQFKEAIPTIDSDDVSIANFSEPIVEYDLEVAERVQAALNQLKPKCKEYLLSKYVNEQFLKNMADDLDLKEGTMRKRFKTCKDQFREIYTKMMNDE